MLARPSISIGSPRCDVAWHLCFETASATADKGPRSSRDHSWAPMARCAASTMRHEACRDQKVVGRAKARAEKENAGPRRQATVVEQMRCGSRRLRGVVLAA
ncbi:hypothetical protein RJ55_03731 [Drechmeria coniospora]|nr:hypothetical protein RJ55_03731 [Drechmeria coniospora]